jgi:hypothetical protein
MIYARVLVLITGCLFLSGCGDELNVAPVADAGEDQVVETGSTVTLDGSGSFDEDEDVELSFDWVFETLPAGSGASLSDSSSSAPTFTADVSGTYEASLVVNDGVSESDEDRVEVIATSQPVADAGEDQTVTAGDTVQLDGSGSTDADEDTLTFEWTLSIPDGSGASLSDTSAEATDILRAMRPR